MWTPKDTKRTTVLLFGSLGKKPGCLHSLPGVLFSIGLVGGWAARVGRQLTATEKTSGRKEKRGLSERGSEMGGS